MKIKLLVSILFIGISTSIFPQENQFPNVNLPLEKIRVCRLAGLLAGSNPRDYEISQDEL